MNNPVLNPMSLNGLQTVNVYDSESKIRRNIVTTPDIADEFISSRNEELKSATTKSRVLTAASAVGMIMLGKGSAGVLGTIVNGCFGGMIGAILGQNFIIDPADKKVTQKFINENV